MANISAIKLPDGVTYDIKDDSSGYITGMTILSYGSSTWDDFIAAYNANKVVYCRASSNSNPGTGSQNRLAFMAYVNNDSSPTEVEFQYYRSVSSHSDSQQGDQVYVYKLNKTNGWSVTVREAYSKIVNGTGISKSYSSGTITLGLDTTRTASSSQTGLMSSTDKDKLDGIATGAEANVQSDWSQSDNTADDYIKNKPTIPAGSFIATYGTTTYAEITAAVNAGKSVFCVRNDGFLPLLAVGTSGGHEFSGVFGNVNNPSDVQLVYAYCSSADVWSAESYHPSLYGHTHSKSDVIDFSHTHGNIKNGGDLQTSDVTIANGDKLVVTDSSDSDKVARASVEFDGSTTNKFLSKKGTWEEAAALITSTSTPTADTIAEFDNDAHINSTDMTQQDVDDFVDGLDISGGGTPTTFTLTPNATYVDSGTIRVVQLGKIVQISLINVHLKNTLSAETNIATIPTAIRPVTNAYGNTNNEADLNAYSSASGLCLGATSSVSHWGTLTYITN